MSPNVADSNSGNTTLMGDTIMRKKLTLDLDDLRVDSFDTTPAATADARGTVFGNVDTIQYGCSDGASCNSCEGSCNSCTCYSACGSCCATCDVSCGGTCQSCCATCDASCGGTCGSCDNSCGGTCDWSCNCV